MAGHDFSMGSRFHGNVIALWEGIPALFITVDSRTTEMCRHFSLPTMSIEDFDASKDIRFFYDKADYSEFNMKYPIRLNEFISFLKKNNLPLAKCPDFWYDKKISELEARVADLSRSFQ